MLGELISETHGKITGNRVLPSDGETAKVEISFQESGKILGLEITDMGTYWCVARRVGLYGEGQGAIMTKDGEMVSWKGQGAGRFTGHGQAVSFRGALYCQTSSTKLGRLNGIAVVYEHDVDENGNTHTKLWEWK